MDIKKIIRESLEKVLKEARYKEVSNKFKDALDNLPDSKFSRKNIEALIKKFKEKRPDSAMAYAEEAFGWIGGGKWLKEHTVTFSKADMAKLHKDGKITKKDDEGKEHDYIYNEEFELEKEKMTDPDDMRMYKENMSKGYAVVYRDKAYDKTYTAQIPPGISKAEIVKMLKKVIRVGLEIVSIKSLNEIEVDPDAEFKLDLKHLLKKHLIKKDEEVNESKYVVIDPKGNASPIGSKMQGLRHIKDKKGYHVVLAKNATKARRAIEKAGGKSHSAKVYAQMYNLMKEDSVSESVSPHKAADVIFRKLAASKLIGKQYKRAATNLLTYMIARRNFKVSDPKIVAGYLFQDLEGAKLILPQNRSRAVAVIANLVSNMKLESINEAFIGPFVFSDSMSDAELKAMYQGALDGYANYSKGFQHPKSEYKKAYQAIEKILKKRGINESKYKVAGKSVTLNKGKKADGTDWTVTFKNGKTASLSDVLALIKPLPKGIKKA